MNAGKKMTNEPSTLDMINSVTYHMGLDDEDKTVIEVESTDNSDIKILRLKSGSWSANEPWFIIDENKKLHTMMSIKSVNQIIKNYKETQEENFQLKLEKSIWQNIPIDFQDVWSVAMDEIKTMATKDDKKAKVINLDIERLLSKIKHEHPNLFLNLKDLGVVQR